MKMTSFPADADGDVLRRIEKGGSDMSMPMPLEYNVAIQNLEMVEGLRKDAQALGYESSFIFDSEEGLFFVTLTKSQIASYSNVKAAQAELSDIAKRYGSICDEWGTRGNV